jgi:hypothetical protein
VESLWGRESAPRRGAQRILEAESTSEGWGCFERGTLNADRKATGRERHCSTALRIARVAKASSETSKRSIPTQQPRRLSVDVYGKWLSCDQTGRQGAASVLQRKKNLLGSPRHKDLGHCRDQKCCTVVGRAIVSTTSFRRSDFSGARKSTCLSILSSGQCKRHHLCRQTLKDNLFSSSEKYLALDAGEWRPILGLPAVGI